MRHRATVIVSVLAFVAFACGSDDAAPEIDTQPTERTDATTTAPPTTIPTQSSVATPTSVNDTSVPPTSGEPVSDIEAFSFSEHDLCEWITPERIAEIVAAQYDWDGTATEFDEGTGFPPPGGCGWVLSGGDDSASASFPNVAVWDGSQYSEFDVVVDYEDFSGDVELDDWVAGHPALSDEAVFALGGWGLVRFGFPDEGRVIEMMLDVPGIGFQPDYWTAMAPVADQIMNELGWTT